MGKKRCPGGLAATEYSEIPAHKISTNTQFLNYYQAALGSNMINGQEPAEL